MRIVKERSGRNAELVAATVAVEHLACFDSADACGVASRTMDTIGPSQTLKVGAALSVGIEIFAERNQIDGGLSGEFCHG